MYLLLSLWQLKYPPESYEKLSLESSSVLVVDLYWHSLQTEQAYRVCQLSQNVVDSALVIMSLLTSSSEGPFLPVMPCLTTMIKKLHLYRDTPFIYVLVYRYNIY
jgi:hypothetical protein